MDLSVIIVNYNVTQDVFQCIDSLHKYINNIEFEIIVVDNNSSDRSILQIRELYPEVKLILKKNNNGFGAANNSALEVAQGKFILFVNPDIIFNDNTPSRLMEFLLSTQDAGATGPVQLKPGVGFECYYSFFPGIYSRFTQEFGLYNSAPFMEKKYSGFWQNRIKEGIPFKVDWIIGSCLMIRREVYEKIGGFDEAFFLYEEEVDLLYRMNKIGKKSFILPDCSVIHNHHSSTSKLGSIFIQYHEYRSRMIFSAKQFGFIQLLLKRLLTLSSLFFRLLYFSITDFKSLKISEYRFFIYYDLLKMNFRSRKNIINSRFIFNDYVKLFSGTYDARL